MTKILITGANGFLGQYLTIFLANHSFSVIATSRGECRIEKDAAYKYVSVDLCNEKEVENLISTHQPNIIIHNAAMSKPDECENDQPTCILNNVTATKYIVDAANTIGAKVIYISTDFIFGDDGPHAVDAIPNPLNFYGASKLQAEQYVQANAQNFAIVRPVFIYGEVWKGMRPTFLHWVKNNLEQQKPIKVVSDQLRTPTYVIDICKGIESIIVNNKQGAYHLAGKDIVSPYQMAVAVCKHLRLDESLITSVTSETFPEPVKRAKKSGLKIDHSVHELHYNPVDFATGVALSLG